MSRITFDPKFVHTKNVRTFQSMMDALMLSDGEGRLGLVWGRAGRGKTRTTIWHQSNHNDIYLRMATVWDSSPGAFLRALCRELGNPDPPSRKAQAYADAVDRLMDRNCTVFLDEIEKLPAAFLDIVRDLSDVSNRPFVLVGEEKLRSHMERNRRVWSRTFQQIEFEPLDQADMIKIAGESAGVSLSASVSAIMHRASGGDVRLFKRDLITVIDYANAKQTREITEEMAQTAVKMGLKGGR